MALRLVPVPPERKGRAELEQEAADLLRQRVRQALSDNNKMQRIEFTAALKKHIWNPQLLLRLSQEAFRDKDGFVAWQCKNAKASQIATLKDVRAIGVFMQLLLVIRDLYGEDLAGAVSFKDSTLIAVEEILLHP